MQGMVQAVGHSEGRKGGDGGERTRTTRASVQGFGRTQRQAPQPTGPWAWKLGVRPVGASDAYGRRRLSRSRWRRWGSRRTWPPAGSTSTRSDVPNGASGAGGTAGVKAYCAQTDRDGICRDREYNKADGCGTLPRGCVAAAMPSPLAGLRSRKVRLRPCFVVVLRAAGAVWPHGCRNCHNNGQGVSGCRRVRTPPRSGRRSRAQGRAEPFRRFVA